MKRRKRSLTLRKSLLLIVLAGYMALLVLLLVMSWRLISNYQAENHKIESAVLEKYIDKTQDAMDNIDRHLYDVYAYNSDFNKLSGILTPIENYSHAYSLYNAMQNKLLLEEDIHGFFIYYDRLSIPWYSTNTAHIKSSMASGLNDILKLHVDVNSNMRQWSVIPYEDEVALMVSCRKENVAISGVYSLDNIEEHIQQGLNKNFQIVLIDNSSVLRGNELEDSLKLRSRITTSLSSFSGRIGYHYVYAKRIEKTNLWVCLVLEYNFWSFMGVPQLTLLIITLFSIFAITILYCFLRKEYLHPLHQLTKIMNQIRIGEIQQAPVMDVRFKEIHDVSMTLAAMVSEIEKQKLLTYEEIIEKQRAQMQYLQLQLKPHFYLNGLKTLNALITDKDTNKMKELIYSLSDHLRYLLQSDRELVYLHMEIDFVKNYIKLQKYMIGREVHCEFSVEDRVSKCLVPVLCIQTFVENSIKYAKFGSSNIPLYITVSASPLYVDGKHFIDLIVSDNGQGYSEAELEQLNGESVIGDVHIGINNIKRRCRLLYGERAEYMFSNNDGAMSELILPEEITE